MWWPCRRKFITLQQDERSDVQVDTPDAQLIPGRFHMHRLVREPQVIFNVLRKLWAQAEDVLDSNVAAVPLDDVHLQITDALKLTASFLRLNKNGLEVIGESLRTFEHSILHVTDLDADVLSKLVGGLVRQPDELSARYVHLYLEVLWMLLQINGDINQALTQLTYLNLKTYERNKGACICSCVRSLWLRLQLYCEHGGVDFWGALNAVLECHDNSFSVALVTFAAFLQRYDRDGHYIGERYTRVRENVEFLGRKWAEYLKTDPAEDELLRSLRTMEATVSRLWLDSARLDFLYVTWDHYYKKLELFDVGGDLLKSVEVVHGEAELDSSYLQFIRILHIHLVRHTQHWNKFRGRIYTRFSPLKFGKLNERGARNLFLIMSTIADISIDEIAGKLLEFIGGVPPEKRNQPYVWNLYITLIELNLKHKRSVKACAIKFVQLLNEASVNRTLFHLIATFATKIDAIITPNQHDQSTLFGPWIENYLKACKVDELSAFLNGLIFAVQRITECGVWYQYESAFGEFVLPVLKRLAAGCPPPLVGSLAGLIGAEEASYFASELVAPTVSSAFFTALSRNPLLSQDHAVLKAWFQCSLVGEAGPEFTRFAMNVELVKELGLVAPYGIEGFISAVGGDRDVCRVCFDGLEKWLSRHLGSCSESTIVQVYTYLGAVFVECGRLLYSRSATTCPLSKLVDLLLLPTDLLRGISPTAPVLKAVEKSWHLYALAVHNLIQSGDPYLERVLKDLVVRYVPFFQAKATPFAATATKPPLLHFALTKINNEFFVHGTKSDHTAKAMSVVHNLLESASNLEQAVLLAEVTLPGVLDVYMFKTQRVAAIDFVKLFTKSPWYRNDVLRAALGEALVQTARKHLPFNTTSYFQMMYVLARIVPSDVRGVLRKIGDEVRVVETRRGQGFDNSLRSGFEKLKKTLD